MLTNCKSQFWSLSTFYFWSKEEFRVRSERTYICFRKVFVLHAGNYRVTRAAWAMLTMLMLVLILGLVGSGGSQQILTGGGTGKNIKLERQRSIRIFVNHFSSLFFLNYDCFTTEQMDHITSQRNSYRTTKANDFFLCFSLLIYIFYSNDPVKLCCQLAKS